MATIRQIKTVKEVAENGGSIGKAMRKAGYSDVSSNTPKKLTESKGFKQLMKEAGLTDELALKTHHELLTDDEKPVKGKALELYYKITARTKQAEIQVNNVIAPAGSFDALLGTQPEDDDNVIIHDDHN